MDAGKTIDAFESKAHKVREHIKRTGYITSWDAIVQYGATRLSAVIYDAKKEHGGSMDIGVFSATSTKVDANGRRHTSRFAVYYDAEKYTEEDIRARMK